MSKVEKVAGDFLTFFGLIKHEYLKPAEHITRTTLSPTQFHTLGVLYRRSSLPMSELAGLLKISKQQLTPLIDKLSDCQLVSRELDEQDRRVVRIELTDKGLLTFRSVFHEIRRSFVEKLKQLPEENLDELENMLMRMTEILSPNSQRGQDNE